MRRHLSKLLVIAALVIIAGISAALMRRGKSAPPAPVPDVPLEFVRVNPTYPFPFPNLSMAEKLKFDIAWAAASAPAILQGKKITWSWSVDLDLQMAVIQYCSFAGRPAYLETSIRANKVGALDFAAITAGGITKDFEKAMKTNQIAFVRDHTNGVWIMSTAHEPSFRHSLAAAH
jgi:hypothetical protein